MRKIEKFTGDHRFLSNFYPALVRLPDEDHAYPSVEHAYQAAKLPPGKRQPFRNLSPDEAGKAKRMGRGKAPAGWRERNLALMENLVRQKFREPRLRRLLLATGDAELVEGNWWGDRFFGVCDGEGRNELGKMLMRVRSSARRSGTGAAGPRSSPRQLALLDGQ